MISKGLGSAVVPTLSSATWSSSNRISNVIPGVKVSWVEINSDARPTETERQNVKRIRTQDARRTDLGGIDMVMSISLEPNIPKPFKK